MKSKLEIVIAILENGHKIKLGNTTYVMSEEGELGTPMIKDGEEICMLVDQDFNGFVKMCNKLTEEEIFKLVSNLTLTKK